MGAAASSRARNAFEKPPAAAASLHPHRGRSSRSTNIPIVSGPLAQAQSELHAIAFATQDASLKKQLERIIGLIAKGRVGNDLLVLEQHLAGDNKEAEVWFHALISESNRLPSKRPILRRRRRDGFHLQSNERSLLLNDLSVDSGQLAEAEAGLEVAARNHGSDSHEYALALVARGTARDSRGGHDEALDDFALAVALAEANATDDKKFLPLRAAAWHKKASTYSQLGRLEEAIDACESALACKAPQVHTTYISTHLHLVRATICLPRRSARRR